MGNFRQLAEYKEQQGYTPHAHRYRYMHRHRYRHGYRHG